MTEQTQATDPADRTPGPARTAGQPPTAERTGTTGTESAPEAAETIPHEPDTAGAPDAPVTVPFRDRMRLRAALRWTAVAAVFATLGAGTAYGITRMERTDVPGLATESDGRWDYPRITRPPLPAGAGPYDAEDPESVHAADLRALLLPAPAGATEDKALRGEDGWLSGKDFVTVFAEKEDRAEVLQMMTDHGLRHVAARGWTTPDGTRTHIHLLRFATGEVGYRVYEELVGYGAPTYAVVGAPSAGFDDRYPSAADPRGLIRYAYDEERPRGPEHVRQAYVRAGDVIALIVQSRRGTAAAVPFQQTVTLQSQLLS